MSIDKKIYSSTQAMEIYISAIPEPSMPVEKQAEIIYEEIKNILQESNASIFFERIFAVEEVIDIVLEIRSRVYGNIEDGVEPACLITSEGTFGKFAGIQVYAVSTETKPEVTEVEGTACGRILHLNDKTYIGLTAVSGNKNEDAPSQASEMFRKAALAIERAGGSMKSVVRTWVWLKDILTWYGEFNKVRTNFFKEHGLIHNRKGHYLPASTGIGVGPAGNAECALDVFAVVDKNNTIQHLTEGGEQGSAFDYGSAFSRASSSATPAGKTVFVSGTAAVSMSGETEYTGNGMSQIDATMSHVRAILNDMGCTENDIVHSVVYCKTPDIEREFNKKYDNLPWPRIVVISDICRDDLLFEVEVTAFIE